MKSDKKKETVHDRARARRLQRAAEAETLDVWYAHPDGFLDPRDPSPRAVVGPILSRIGDQIVITAAVSNDEIRAMRSYRYHQLQIT